MTYEEYLQKRNKLAVSAASPEAIEEAIKQLDSKYSASHSLDLVRLQIEECAADTNDIGNHDE